MIKIFIFWKKETWNRSSFWAYLLARFATVSHVMVKLNKVSSVLYRFTPAPCETAALQQHG